MPRERESATKVGVCLLRPEHASLGDGVLCFHFPAPPPPPHTLSVLERVIDVVDVTVIHMHLLVTKTKIARGWGSRHIFGLKGGVEGPGAGRWDKCKLFKTPPPIRKVM